MTKIYQQRCTALSSLLLLVSCSCLELPDKSMDCRPCSCDPDPIYGGILANCSNNDLTHVSLPAPGNITTLLFDYNNLGKMSTSDFQRLVNLRYLSLRGSSLRSIEKAPSVVFTKLDYLDLSRNLNLGFAEVVKLASWFKMNTLKTLFLNCIITLKMPIVPLDGLYCSFPQHLKELHMDGNIFSYLGKDCISFFPKTIEILTLRFCTIGGIDFKNLTGLFDLKSLKVLDLTGFVTWNPGDGHSRPWHKRTMLPLVPLISSVETFRYGQSFLHMDVGKSTFFPTTNNLTTIDVSRNLLISLLGPWTGLGKVENVDVSQNTISSLGKRLFVGSNNVKFLNLSNNDLGRFVAADTSGVYLKQLNNLEVLDMSKNEIIFLPKLTFQGLDKLRELKISGNQLKKFDVDIIHMSNLSELDLRNNKLSTLPQGVIEQLDQLPKVKLIIDHNPLSCSCETLEFLEWMRESNRLQEMHNQTCILTNGTNIKLQFLNDILSSLHETCKSSLSVTILSVSGTIVAVLLFVIGMVHRYKWKFKYLYVVGRKRFQLLREEEEGHECYEYDAFISYADKDRTFVIEKMLVELETNSKLKVCIHNRDFLPGTDISDNIINAIQKSRKTVIVLSPEFLKSEWCIFEFNMARQDGITRKLNNLLVILLEEVSFEQLPKCKDLELMMTKHSYQVYNTDIYGQEVFWKTLTEGIKTINRLE